MARFYGARTASRAYRDRARQRRRAFLRGGIKWLCYAVIALLLCVTEGTLFAFQGASAAAIGTPYFLPAWVTAVAMLEGTVGGAWFGIAAGLLSSAAGGDALYVLPVFYMLYGFSIGMLGGHFLKKGFWFYAVYETAVCMLHGMFLLAFSVISAAFAGESFGVVLPMLWTGILSDMIVSALWCLPLYLPLALIRRITKDKTDGSQSFPA